MSDLPKFIRCEKETDILVVPDHLHPEDYSRQKNPCHNHQIMRECQYKEAISEAVKAERERCAGIAKNHICFSKESGPHGTCEDIGCEFYIEEEIRRQGGA